MLGNSILYLLKGDYRCLWAVGKIVELCLRCERHVRVDDRGGGRLRVQGSSK